MDIACSKYEKIKRDSFRISFGITKTNGLLDRRRRRWKNNIVMGLKEIGRTNKECGCGGQRQGRVSCF
jgi:hypothetical protein